MLDGKSKAGAAVSTTGVAMRSPTRGADGFLIEAEVTLEKRHAGDPDIGAKAPAACRQVAAMSRPTWNLNMLGN